MISLTLAVLLAGPALPSATAPVYALVEARDLLRARRHRELTALVEARQVKAATGPEGAAELRWTLSAFRLDDPAIPTLIADWVRADGGSWAPLLARGVNAAARAQRARGGRLASETSEESFRQMRELLAAARADCREVLSRDPAVCTCYVELVQAAKKAPVEADPLVARAFEICPRDYALHVETVFGLTPRWGGSYEQMSAAIDAARRRGLSAADVRALEAYIPADKASVLVLDRRYDDALRILDEAIASTPTAMLLQERARLHQRRRAPEAALRDANAAIELSRGGWGFSERRLTDLLVSRAFALDALGRRDEARLDIALAHEIAPRDTAVLSWRGRLGSPGPGAR
jgi:tetratricopeptide (TPR) repeat protein